MAEPQTFHEAYLFGLRDSYDAEQRFARALPVLAEAARSRELRRALASRLEATRVHVARLAWALCLLDEDGRGGRCEPVAAILEKGMDNPADELDDAAIDAALIDTTRRVGHYQSVSYATLGAWAAAMRHLDVSRLLRMILDEEKSADRELSLLAERCVRA